MLTVRAYGVGGKSSQELADFGPSGPAFVF
jgi:hypothetical protein